MDDGRSLDPLGVTNDSSRAHVVIGQRCRTLTPQARGVAPANSRIIIGSNFNELHIDLIVISGCFLDVSDRRPDILC